MGSQREQLLAVRFPSIFIGSLLKCFLLRVPFKGRGLSPYCYHFYVLGGYLIHLSRCYLVLPGLSHRLWLTAYVTTVYRNSFIITPCYTQQIALCNPPSLWFRDHWAIHSNPALSRGSQGDFRKPTLSTRQPFNYDCTEHTHRNRASVYWFWCGNNFRTNLIKYFFRKFRFQRLWNQTRAKIVQ